MNYLTAILIIIASGFVYNFLYKKMDVNKFLRNKCKINTIWKCRVIYFVVLILGMQASTNVISDYKDILSDIALFAVSLLFAVTDSVKGDIKYYNKQ